MKHETFIFVSSSLENQWNVGDEFHIKIQQ